jgi:hypothetical protein
MPVDIQNVIWLDLLHAFASVMNLYLSGQVAPRIVPALSELVGARTMQVLPTLQNIFLEELQSSRDLFRKASGGSLLRDKSPVIL